MTTIYGHNEGEARLKRETMEPCTHVAIDHDFYSENPEAHSKKTKKHEEREKHAKGDSVGMEDREKYAAGMAAKKRRHYPMT